MFDTTVNFAPLVIMAITTVGMPLAVFLGKLAIAKAVALAEPYIGHAQALVVQQRVDALLDKGIGEAALHYLPELQAKGLTIDTGNLIAARVVDYAINHAPDLSAQAKSFEGSLEEKVKGRLITHPAVAAAVASGVPVPSHPVAAAA